MADDAGGSGFSHVTLYVAVDGGNYTIFQRQLTVATGSFVYAGAAGHTYQFLALATRQCRQPGTAGQTGTMAVPRRRDGEQPGHRALGRPARRRPNFGVAPAPVATPSTNALFTAAQQDVPSVATVSSIPAGSRPCWRRSWPSGSPAGIAQSDAGIGPAGDQWRWRTAAS